MKELICICCPNGCHLKVDEENGYTVSGHKCDRGAVYGKAELQHPVRVVTSTVKTNSATYPRLPVKTDCAVDKDKMFDVMSLLEDVTVAVPVSCGDVILPAILGTDANIIACRDLTE